MTATPEQVLTLPVGHVILRTYLIDLLSTLWAQGSDFSAKRPFGSSDWQWVVYGAMVRAGYVQGEIDGDGELVDADTAAADALIGAAITSLAQPRVLQAGG